MKTVQLLELVAKIHWNKPNNTYKDELLAALIEGHENDFNRAVVLEGIGQFTPLMYAVYLGCFDALEIFLRFGRVAHLQQKNSFNLTALDWAYASPEPDLNCIQLLLRAGAKTGAAISDNNPPSETVEAAIQAFALNTQNTHDLVLVESVLTAINALALEYKITDKAAIISEIKAAIATLPEAELQKLLNNFLNHHFMQFKYPQSECTLEQLLCLVWLAIHDHKLFLPNEDAVREASLLLRMQDAQRGIYGACAEGRCHALLETVDRIHPKVNLCYGNAAVKDLLFMRFKYLFKQQLLQQSNAKALILAADYSADEAEFQLYQEFYAANKAELISQLHSEFPQAFLNGSIETATVDAQNKPVLVKPGVWFLQHLSVEDIPLEIAEFEAIKQLQQFHQWLCELAPPATPEQSALAQLINNKLSANDPQDFTAAHAEIMQAASSIYPQLGWLQLITPDKNLKYFSGLRSVINHMPAASKAAIAKQIQHLELEQLAKLNLIWAYVIKYLLEFNDPDTNTQIFAFLPEELSEKIKVLTTAFARTAIWHPAKQNTISREFIRQCKLQQLHHKLNAKLSAESWLNHEQIQSLEDELQQKDVTAQAEFIDLLACFHKAMHYPAQRQAQALEEFIQHIIAKPQLLQQSNFLQQLLLSDQNTMHRNFLHCIASHNNPQLFALLTSIYSNNVYHKVTLAKALAALDIFGAVPIRLACKAKNKMFVVFVNNLDPEPSQAIIKISNHLPKDAKHKELTHLLNVFGTSLYTMLKYNDNVASIYLLEHILSSSPHVLNHLNSLWEALPFCDANLPVLQWLIQHIPNVRLTKDLILSALQNGDIGIIKLMLKRNSIDKIPFWNSVEELKDSFFVAAMYGCNNIIQLLLDQVKDNTELLKTSEPESGINCFHIASIAGHNSTLQLLLSKCKPADLMPLLQQKCNMQTQGSKNRTLLNIAILNADLEIAKTLIDACPSAADKSGLILSHYGNILSESALHFAAARGFSAGVRLFLEYISEAELISDLYPTMATFENPLRLAAAHGDVDSMLAILAKLTDEKQRVACLTHPNSEGTCALHDIASLGNVEQLKKLLAFFPLNIANEMIYAVRDKAILHKKDATFPTLLAALPINDQANFLYTKATFDNDHLSIPVIFGKAQTVKLLFAANPDVAEKQQLLTNKLEDEGYTYLHLAAISGDVATFEFIYNQLAPEVQQQMLYALTQNSFNLAQLAIEQQKFAMLKHIMSLIPTAAQRDYLDHKNHNNQTALFIASDQGNAEIFTYLLNYYATAADVMTIVALLRQKNEAGERTIFGHINKNNPTMIAALLKACPKPYLCTFLFQRDRNGNTPLHSAAILASPHILQQLLDACDPAVRYNYITQTNNHGMTALESTNRHDNHKLLLSYYPTEAIFADPQLLDKKHFRQWLKSKQDCCIIDLMKATGIKLINDAHSSIYHLQHFKAKTLIQTKMRNLLIAILKIRDAQGTTVETCKTLLDLLQLMQQPAEARLQQQCLTNIAKLQQRSWGQVAAIAALALVGVILSVAAAITFVPTAGLSIGLLVGAACAFTASAALYKYTPKYKNIAKLTRDVVVTETAPARRDRTVAPP